MTAIDPAIAEARARLLCQAMLAAVAATDALAAANDLIGALDARIAGLEGAAERVAPPRANRFAKFAKGVPDALAQRLSGTEK